MHESRSSEQAWKFRQRRFLFLFPPLSSPLLYHSPPYRLPNMSVKLEPPTPDWKSSLRYLAQTPRKVELNFFFEPIRPREPSFRKDSTSRKDGKDKENPSDGGKSWFSRSLESALSILIYRRLPAFTSSEFNCKTEDVSPKKKKDKKEQRPILGK